MKKQIIGLAAVAVLLAGCWQKSVYPFYTEKDLIGDPKLAGTWSEKADAEGNRNTWSFMDVGEKRLEVVVQDKNTKYEFEVRLFKLGDARFLDFEGKARGISTVPAHHLFRVVELGNELKLAPLNTDWVQKWLRKNPGALSYVTLIDPEHRDDREKDELVLTADTKALQKFVREHLNEKDFFVEPTLMTK